MTEGNGGNAVTERKGSDTLDRREKGSVSKEHSAFISTASSFRQYGFCVTASFPSLSLPSSGPCSLPSLSLPSSGGGTLHGTLQGKGLNELELKGLKGPKGQDRKDPKEQAEQRETNPS